MPYGQPDKAEKFSPRDNPQWLGKLFLIYTNEVDTVVFTKPDGSQDPTKIAHGDVAIIDLIDPQTGKATILLGARIGGKALVPQLTKNAGTGIATLGRLRKLPAQGQKEGAYVLDDYTPADGALADQFEAIAGDWRGKFSQPAPTPPAAAATPGVSTAALTPPTAVAPPAAAVSGPWFTTPAGIALLPKLYANGVDVQGIGDLATAKLVANSLPG